MTCKGICQKYKAKRTDRGHYMEGHKRCQICELFLDVEELFCPCCGYRLRTKPRSKQYKQQLRSRMPEKY